MDWQKKMTEPANQHDFDLADYNNKHAINLAKFKAQLDGINNPQIAEKLGVNLTGNKIYDEALLKDKAKSDAEKKQAITDFNQSKPTVISAMKRAYASADNGTGLGGIGGTSLNPMSWFGNEANKNRANIESANTQMNTILRKQLASTGLTGSELNSAVEAQAYRYTISPKDNERAVKQKLNNFMTDVLGENPVVLRRNDLKNKYGLE
jgi:hypothetical protein